MMRGIVGDAPSAREMRLCARIHGALRYLETIVTCPSLHRFACGLWLAHGTHLVPSTPSRAISIGRKLKCKHAALAWLVKDLMTDSTRCLEVTDFPSRRRLRGGKSRGGSVTFPCDGDGDGDGIWSIDEAGF